MVYLRKIISRLFYQNKVGVFNRDDMERGFGKKSHLEEIMHHKGGELPIFEAPCLVCPFILYPCASQCWSDWGWSILKRNQIYCSGIQFALRRGKEAWVWSINPLSVRLIWNSAFAIEALMDHVISGKCGEEIRVWLRGNEGVVLC